MELFTDKQIGAAIKAARTAAHWSAKQLAGNCGFSSSALNKIENGKQALTFAEAVFICSSLGIRVDHLVTLARVIEPLAYKTSSPEEHLVQDLKLFEQKAIKLAILTRTSKSVEATENI